MFIYEKLSNIGIKIVRFFFIIFAVLFIIGNIFFTVRIDNFSSGFANYEFGFNIINIFIFLVIGLMLYFLIINDYFGISERKMIVVFLFMAFVVALYWLLSNDYRLIDYDDAYNVFRTAKSVANYDYNVLGKYTYTNTYPNNLGLMTYELMCIRIFGELGAVYCIRLINIFIMLLGYLYLYRITHLLFANRIVDCTLIYLMFFSGQFIFYSFFMYGNCLSYGLAIISVYYLIRFTKREKNIDILLSSICIILAIFIKMNSMIILIAELLYLFLYFIKIKKIVIIISILISIVGSYLGTTGIQEFWSIRGETNYNNTRLPTICWVAYGLNYDDRNPGHYFPEFELFHYNNDFASEYTSLEAKRYINTAFNAFAKNPSLAVKFYFQKFLVSWADPQYGSFDQYKLLDLTGLNKDIINGNINYVIRNIWDATLSIVAIGVLAFLFIKYKNRQIIDYIGCVIIIGGFLFHIIWEVKPIYLYQYYMYLLPYAANGLVSIANVKRKAA